MGSGTGGSRPDVSMMQVYSRTLVVALGAREALAAQAPQAARLQLRSLWTWRAPAPRGQPVQHLPHQPAGALARLLLALIPPAEAPLQGLEQLLSQGQHAEQRTQVPGSCLRHSADWGGRCGAGPGGREPGLGMRCGVG